jgi:SAM-dependent methyltransferase
LSNPYPARFTTLLDALSPEELALDCGCGPRAAPHPQCVQLDIDPIYTGVDLWADGLELPFRDDSFSAILSQAVIEHVTEPDRYVRECRRVLRPGGVMYAEVAFLQPVHQAPHHYFNVTPFGLRWLFRDWEIIDEGDIGRFDEMIEWLYRSAGLSAPRGIPQWAKTPENVSSGVWMLARKPLPTR